MGEDFEGDEEECHEDCSCVAVSFFFCDVEQRKEEHSVDDIVEPFPVFFEQFDGDVVGGDAKDDHTDHCNETKKIELVVFAEIALQRKELVESDIEQSMKKSQPKCCHTNLPTKCNDIPYQTNEWEMSSDLTDGFGEEDDEKEHHRSRSVGTIEIVFGTDTFT